MWRSWVSIWVAATVWGCGTTASLDAGPPDAGALDAGATDCQEPYRTCSVHFEFRAIDEQRVELRGDFAPNGWSVGVPMTRSGSVWHATVDAPFGADIQYRFLVNNTVSVTDPKNPPPAGAENSLRKEVRCEAYTCAPAAPQLQAFDWRDAVMAFVFVDRFFDGDSTNNCAVNGATFAGQYQGGDWKGVQQKVEEGYFDALGVNVLWLTVPLKNSSVPGGGGDGRLYSGYHGYWPVDLEQTESCFGTDAELQALVTTAHARGLKVLFDFAMVHVHSSSPLFAQHPEWFWPLSFQGGQCTCNDNGVCPWNQQGLRCWFSDSLPHWNYTVPEARRYSVNAAVSLLQSTGADGFRLDAIKHVEDVWLTDLRTELNALAAAQSPRPRVYLVGETYEFGNRPYLKSFVDPVSKLDGQFDFPLRTELLEAVLTRRAPMTQLRAFVDSNDAFYGPNALMSPWVGNHDLGRVIHMAEDTPLWSSPYADGKDHAFDSPPLGVPTSRRPFERLANAFAFLLTSPGVPLLYYGDEVGLPGGGDPDNRRFMTWSGLTADQLWLRERVQKLGHLRRELEPLRRGHRRSLSATADTYVYAMEWNGQTVVIAINRGDTEQAVSGLEPGLYRDALEGVTLSAPGVRVPARSTRVLQKQP